MWRCSVRVAVIDPMMEQSARKATGSPVVNRRIHFGAVTRIPMSSLDLIANPISPVEARLVRFIFQNIFLAFEARQAGQLGDIGNLEKDVAEFIARPIPKAVWKEIARFQPDAFRKFVEALM